MCIGGRLLADFSAGASERPAVPEIVDRCLTTTVDGTWVVWASKVAHPVGGQFMPLTGGDPYPADAVAECRRGGGHVAPQPGCTCGFHALSHSGGLQFPVRPVAHLDVVLSGRVLAFEWSGHGLLFRAARQTVIRVTDNTPRWLGPPADPSGRLVPVLTEGPKGSGPRRLRVPQAAPPVVALNDDAGYCVLAGEGPARHRTGVLAAV